MLKIKESFSASAIPVPSLSKDIPVWGKSQISLLHRLNAQHQDKNQGYDKNRIDGAKVLPSKTTFTIPSIGSYINFGVAEWWAINGSYFLEYYKIGGENTVDRNV